MTFIKSFFISALAAAVVYISAVMVLIDAPVEAEYWVAEMITIKKELVKQYAGKSKIIIAGGSSTLFGIDAEYASKQLGMPVINFGLHAGLRLNKILEEVSGVIEHGDILILPLEPPYYRCNTTLNSWQVTNIVAWDHGAWGEMNVREKIEFAFLISPKLFRRMLVAKIQEPFNPAKIAKRLEALDNSLVLAKFRVRKSPVGFEYSAYNLNNHGDMLRTEGSDVEGQSSNYSKPSHVCANTASYLIDFIDSMRKRGVRVYFANTPYIASEGGIDHLKNGDLSFRNELAPVGCIIDKREELVFDRKYFFNSNLHLNAEGRLLRTELLIKSIRNNACSEPVLIEQMANKMGTE